MILHFLLLLIARTRGAILQVYMLRTLSIIYSSSPAKYACMHER